MGEYASFVIVCGYCNKEHMDEDSEEIEECIEKALELGWTKDDAFGILCPNCSKDT
jgi:hypothetical protein